MRCPAQPAAFPLKILGLEGMIIKVQRYDLRIGWNRIDFLFPSGSQKNQRLASHHFRIVKAGDGRGSCHIAVVYEYRDVYKRQLPISVPDPLQPEREEDSYYIGEIKVTEVESLIPVTITDPNGEKELEFKVGYGITMGQSETKAIAMSILDTCLESEDKGFAVNDEEFVLYHIDAVEATGFISHLKLPHYVTFQSKLNSMRKTKKEQADDEKEI